MRSPEIYFSLRLWTFSRFKISRGGLRGYSIGAMAYVLPCRGLQPPSSAGVCANDEHRADFWTRYILRRMLPTLELVISVC
jgi:hypothetical protein